MGDVVLTGGVAARVLIPLMEQKIERQEELIRQLRAQIAKLESALQANTRPAQGDGNPTKAVLFRGLQIGQRVTVTLPGSVRENASGTVCGFHAIPKPGGGYEYLVEVAIESADSLGEFRCCYYPQFLFPV